MNQCKPKCFHVIFFPKPYELKAAMPHTHKTFTFHCVHNSMLKKRTNNPWVFQYESFPHTRKGEKRAGPRTIPLDLSMGPPHSGTGSLAAHYILPLSIPFVHLYDVGY